MKKIKGPKRRKMKKGKKKKNEEKKRIIGLNIFMIPKKPVKMSEKIK